MLFKAYCIFYECGFVLFNVYPAWTTSDTAFANSIEQDQHVNLYCLIRLYTVGWRTSSSHLDIPKMIIDCSKIER